MPTKLPTSGSRPTTRAPARPTTRAPARPTTRPTTRATTRAPPNEDTRSSVPRMLIGLGVLAAVVTVVTVPVVLTMGTSPPSSTPQECTDTMRSVRTDETLACTAPLSEVTESFHIGEFYDMRFITVDGVNLCPFLFSTTLTHNEEYRMASCDSVQTLIDYLKCSGDESGMDVDPSSSRAVYAAGDSGTTMCGLPRLSGPNAAYMDPVTQRQALELAELYVLTLIRDCPLHAMNDANCQYLTRGINFLNSFSSRPYDYTPDNIGAFPFKDDVQPRLSQHWFLPQRVGASPPYRRLYNVQRSNTDVWRREQYYESQQGNYTNRQNYETSLKYVHSCRSLGSNVNGEPVYSTYFLAALGTYELLSTVEKDVFERQPPGSYVYTSINGGYDDLLVSIAEVSRYALAESYRRKYWSYLRARPVQFASMVDLLLSDKSTGVVRTFTDHFDTVERRNFLNLMGDLTQSDVGEFNYLLRTQYITDNHPSFPHGHGTVAGAAVTIIKAMLRLETEFGQSVVWPRPMNDGSEDGTTLNTKTGQTTFTAELNKLAFNVALGRMCVGQHFNTEAYESLLFGEEIGIQFLRKRLCDSDSQTLLRPFRFERFDGTKIILRGCTDPIEVFIAPPRPPRPPPSQSSPPSPPVPSSVTPMLQPIHSAIDGSVENFLSLSPKPTLTLVLDNSVMHADRIGFTQRSMSHGDSCTRQAMIVINGDIVRYVTYGLPTPGGFGGTCLTDHVEDAYGRVCVDGKGTDMVNDDELVLPETMFIDLDGVHLIKNLTYTVLQVYPYRKPSPLRYGGRGGIKGGRTVAEDARVDNFFRDGTWDVGLVAMYFYINTDLIPNPFVNVSSYTTYDNVDYAIPSYDAPSNAFLNPYRSSDCRLQMSELQSDQTRCTPTMEVEDSWYFKRVDSSSICDILTFPFAPILPCSMWPCVYWTESLSGGDCSNIAVPKSWGFMGFSIVHGLSNRFSLVPRATKELFSRFVVKPTIGITFPLPVLMNKLDFRQRNMAFMDATFMTARVTLNNVLTFDVYFGTTCETGTCLTDLTLDDFGRNGVAEKRSITFTEMNVNSIVFEVIDIYEYTPPAETYETPADETWGITVLQKRHSTWFNYVQSHHGSFNFGLTEFTMLLNNVPIPESQLGILEQTVTVSGGNDTKHLPFRYAYVPDSERFTNGSSATAILNSWVWPGHRALIGELPDFTVYRKPSPPPPAWPEGEPEPGAG